MAVWMAASTEGRLVEHSAGETAVLKVDSWDSWMAVRTVAYSVALTG